LPRARWGERAGGQEGRRRAPRRACEELSTGVARPGDAAADELKIDPNRPPANCRKVHVFLLDKPFSTVNGQRRMAASKGPDSPSSPAPPPSPGRNASDPQGRSELRRLLFSPQRPVRHDAGADLPNLPGGDSDAAASGLAPPRAPRGRQAGGERRVSGLPRPTVSSVRRARSGASPDPA